MTTNHGELAIFTLLHNYFYTNSVCKAVVELSEERVSELEEKLRKEWDDDMGFIVTLKDSIGKDLLYAALSKRKYFNESEAAEVELMIQLDQNIRRAKSGIEELKKAYEDKDISPEDLVKIPDAKLDSDQIKDKAFWVHFTRTIENGGLAPEPINHKVYKDNEQNVEIISTIDEKDVYLIAHLHDRKTPEKKIQRLWRAIDGKIPDWFGGFFERLKKSLYEEIVDIVYPDLQNVMYKHKATVEIFLDTLVRAKPNNISLLTPYMMYSRGDQQHASEAITSTVVTRIFQMLGVNSYIPFTLHAGQVRGQGDPTKMTIENLLLRYNIEEYVLNNYFDHNEDFVVMATDAGGGKETQKYAENMGRRMALAYKARNYRVANSIENLEILGDISNSKVLIIDDELDTGGSLKKLIEKANSQDAKGIYIAVSHGKFSDPAMIDYFREMKKQKKIEKVLISDTILHSKEFLEENKEWLDVVPTYETYGQAIYHLHCGMGLSELYDRQFQRVTHAINNNVNGHNGH